MTALDTGTEGPLAQVDDGVAVITMNRPSRRNAFSNDMVEALGRILGQVELSDDVGCVVLAGAGDAFSAGCAGWACRAPPAQPQRTRKTAAARVRDGIARIERDPP